MPTYGAEKKRDMSRSVLPSTRRKGAREDKRHIHHKVRTRVRGLIAKGDWDNEGDLLIDPQRGGSYWGIKSAVRDRRDADKVAPLMRWAEANADKLGSTAQERYAKLRAMLPPNIIGWHAMTHVEFLDEFERNPVERWRHRYPQPSDEERRRKAEERYLQLYEALYKVCTGRRLQKRLNEALRKGWRPGHEVGRRWDTTLKRSVRGEIQYCPNCRLGARPLFGIQDIPLFIEEWHSRNVVNRLKFRSFYPGFLVGEEPEVRAHSLSSHGNCWASVLSFLYEEGLLDRSYL